MAIVVDAIYENGMLKPVQPLTLKEREKVRVTIEPEVTWARQSAGMLRWTGDPEELERLALDPEFDPQESA